MKPRHALRMGNAQSRTMTGLLFFCPFLIIHTQKSRRSLYGIYQSGGYGPSDARCCPRCRSAVWGVVNLMEVYGNDNPGAMSLGIKQLMAGGGVVLIGTTLIPLLSGLF